MGMPKTWNDWSLLIVALLIPQLAGAFGSVFTFFAIPLWYNALALPAFAPPNFVFGPVWALLYLLMGVSLYIVWRSRGEGVEKARARKRGLIAFWIQLALNALWPAVFFGLRSPLAGLIDIILLFVAIVATIVYFWQVRKSAAYLLVPYLVWVALAGALNAAIYLIN